MAKLQQRATHGRIGQIAAEGHAWPNCSRGPRMAKLQQRVTHTASLGRPRQGQSPPTHPVLPLPLLKRCSTDLDRPLPNAPTEEALMMLPMESLSLICTAFISFSSCGGGRWAGRARVARRVCTDPRQGAFRRRSLSPLCFWLCALAQKL